MNQPNPIAPPVLQAPPPLPQKQNAPLLVIVVLSSLTLGVLLASVFLYVLLRPQLPIRLSFRSAILDSGYVLIINNQSPKKLPLQVTATNPTFGRSKTWNLVVDSHGALDNPVEIGHLEGWNFASGDSVEASSAGYQATKVIVP